MKYKLVVNVTRDKRVHDILERTISADKKAARLFERVYTSGREELLENIESADVLLSFAVTEAIITKANNLKWIQFASAGVEKSLNPTLLSSNIKITCCRGMHADSIAEYIMMQILAFAKKLPRAANFQREHRWEFEPMLEGKFDLNGKTLCIAGLGSIGRRLAKLASAFDMHVIGTINTPRKVAYVDEVYGAGKLNKCLPQADIVALCTPLTDKTYQLIGAKELALMKTNALIVNIGRGNLIDETALIEALKSGKIAGAGLDVFEVEPLPSDSPLWDMPNVMITPHISGMTDNIWEKVGKLFCENAIRFNAGKRMLGAVSKQKGY
jgi:phosphoglycerate dehydrogenase-like enzyme